MAVGSGTNPSIQPVHLRRRRGKEARDGGSALGRPPLPSRIYGVTICRRRKLGFRFPSHGEAQSEQSHLKFGGVSSSLTERPNWSFDRFDLHHDIRQPTRGAPAPLSHTLPLPTDGVHDARKTTHRYRPCSFAEEHLAACTAWLFSYIMVVPWERWCGLN